MIFNYAEESVFTKQLDLVDAGNTAIRGLTPDQFENYLIIKTVEGKTSFLKFGPVIPDAPLLVEGFSVSYKKVNYNERAIAKEVQLFLNNKFPVLEATEIPEIEALGAFPNLQEAFMNL